MSARGTPGWYRRHDAYDPAREQATMDLRRAQARARGEFDELSERAAFEAFFRDSRPQASFARLGDQTYADDHVQRHWHTWQMAVGAGRRLPKFDPYKAAAEHLAATYSKDAR